METQHIGRRRFLAGTAGAGAAVAGLGSAKKVFGATEPTLRQEEFSQVQPDSVTVVKSITKPPATPVNVQRFLSRPDITPPGVNLVKTAAFGSAYAGYIFLTARSGQIAGVPYPTGASQGMMILDTDGHLVWWSPLSSSNPNPYNFRVQTYNGKPVLTWFAKGSTASPGSCVIADNTYTPIAYVSGVNTGDWANFFTNVHEFVITPQGTALVTSTSTGTVSGQAATIGHAQEIDIATGAVAWDWDSSTQVGIGSSYIHTTVSASNPHPDYFHINSIALWPGTRNYLISSRNTCAVYLVSAKTNEILWRLGGKYSAWKLGQGVPFWWQHDARPLPDGSGVSLFDNSSQPNPGKELYASGKVITLANGQATLKHRLFHYDSYAAAPVEGNNYLLPNGGRMVGFGALPYFSVYAPPTSALRPTMILDGLYPKGCSSYRAFLNNWVANPPESEIGFVIYQNSGSGHWTGHASWNGATEIATWRVHYGPSATNLPYHSLAHPRAGFETAIPITTSLKPQYFQAVAYNSAGQVLGSSAVTQIAN